jgi:translation elongation factor P/translation initiation factor 5A
MDLDVSKPGKHGSAKVLISGTNIFTGKKIQ